MHFEGEFRLPGRPEEVIARFMDIERMARCVPGATLEGRDPDGSYFGAMVVAFGPKRIKFRGKVSCEFDVPACAGLLSGRGVADMRAARFEVRTAFSVLEDASADPSSPSSLIKISSDADLHGVLAAFAGAGGTAVGNVLMRDFARNLVEEYGEKGEASKDEASKDGARAVKAVSAHRVVWSAVKDKTSKALSRGSKNDGNSGDGQ